MIPNSTYIDSLSGGDAVFKQKLIDVINKEFPEEKEAYYACYKANKYIKAAENVHKLKHKISILGLEKSYYIAVDYENNLKEGNTDLHDKFEEILQTMTAYIMTL